MSTSVTDIDRLRRTYQLILKAAGEGIYGLDKDGRTTFVNAAAVRILGWDKEDVLGQLLHDIHHHSHESGRAYPREDCPIYATLQDGEVHTRDTEVFWHQDGQAIPVEYTSTPIFEAGKVTGAVIVFRDISERKRIEIERQKDYAEIRHLKDLLEAERNYLRDEININANFGEIIGESPALMRTLAQIEAVANTSTSVLVLGESGVGKEMIARAIHLNSTRADKPLVKVNCASIPKDLFESEFFGHIAGAFTGASRDRVGRMQLANEGTLFLDEVGEIPLDLQGKLLRALQESEFERVGDNTTIKVDVRIVAATNRDLTEEVKQGRFREDLYYRLSVFPVEVPPLRDRQPDIGPLAQHFLNQICDQLGRERIKLTQANVQQLCQHDWPGNIRELKNVIERAAILSPGTKLQLDLLPLDVSSKNPKIAENYLQDQGILTDRELKAIEKANLIKALRATNGKIAGDSGAAKLLGIKPSTLTYRLSVLAVDKQTYTNKLAPSKSRD